MYSTDVDRRIATYIENRRYEWVVLGHMTMIKLNNILKYVILRHSYMIITEYPMRYTRIISPLV